MQQNSFLKTELTYFGHLQDNKTNHHFLKFNYKFIKKVGSRSILWFSRTVLQMHPYVSLGNEFLVTDVTRVGFFTGVTPLMDDKRRPLREFLAADVTHVAFIAGVDPLVLTQHTLDGETLPAHVTSVGFVSRVNSEVT
jgi:hypothetical protein